MKLSKKYKRQLKKKFLTALSSTAMILMLVAYGKLAGISALFESGENSASIASISSGESTLEDSSNKSSLANSVSSEETSQTLAGGALQTAEANSNNSSDSSDSNSEVSLASEISEENSVADEEGTSNASEDEISVASETESQVSSETESEAVISSVAEVASVGATRLSNTSTTTYIYDAQDLVDFRDEVNSGDTYEGKTVYLMADIDLSSVCSSSIGSWEPIGTDSTYCFAGTFDGNYYTISNLYISSSSYKELGFFTYTKSETVIQNLIMENIYVYNNNYYYTSSSERGTDAGGIVGYNLGTIQNVGIESGSVAIYLSYSGSSSGSQFIVKSGGIAGLSTGSINNCYNKASITTTLTGTTNMQAMTGGICGRNNSGTVSNCYNGGTIKSVKGSTSEAGGIIGVSFNGTLKNCYNYGSVSATSGNNNLKGGIIGRNGSGTNSQYATVTNCYCTTDTTYLYQANSSSKYSTANRVSADTLKTYVVTLGSSYAYDVYSLNSGYPVLAWQNETTVMSLNVNQAYLAVRRKFKFECS